MSDKEQEAQLETAEEIGDQDYLSPDMLDSSIDNPLVPVPEGALMNSPASQADQLIAAIITAAADTSIDLDRMDRLLDIRNTLIKQEAEKSYTAAMSRTQANIGRIVKNKNNDHTKSRYSDLAAINEAVVPAYTAEGMALSFSNKPAEEKDHLVIMCDVSHIDGHTKHFDYVLPYDLTGAQGSVNKTKIHASASTVMYGQRKLTTMIFNIATFDDDGNAGGAATEPGPGAITANTLGEIQMGMQNTDTTLEYCLRYVNTLYGETYTVLSQMTQKEGLRLLHKLSIAADGEQE